MMRSAWAASTAGWVIEPSSRRAQRASSGAEFGEREAHRRGDLERAERGVTDHRRRSIAELGAVEERRGAERSLHGDLHGAIGAVGQAELNTVMSPVISAGVTGRRHARDSLSCRNVCMQAAVTAAAPQGLILLATWSAAVRYACAVPGLRDGLGLADVVFAVGAGGLETSPTNATPNTSRTTLTYCSSAMSECARTQNDAFFSQIFPSAPIIWCVVMCIYQYLWCRSAVSVPPKCNQIVRRARVGLRQKITGICREHLQPTV